MQKSDVTKEYDPYYFLSTPDEMKDFLDKIKSAPPVDDGNPIDVGIPGEYVHPKEFLGALTRHDASLSQGVEGDGGMKYDGGKLLAGILFEDFPNAVEGVLQVATFGAKKYARSSWQTVPNAIQRYEDAFFRHVLALSKGEIVDPESGLLHTDHIAWNALALSELRKKDQ